MIFFFVYLQQAKLMDKIKPQTDFFIIFENYFKNGLLRASQ